MSSEPQHRPTAATPSWISGGAHVDGWRDPHEPKILPDVTLTGDEFVHMLAIQGETLPGNPHAHQHKRSRVPAGFPSPDCTCCQAIMEKSGQYQAHLAARGLDV